MDGENRQENLIQRLREHLGLSKRGLAAKACMDSAQLTKIERGEHGLTVETAMKLGEALGVDAKDLVLGQGFAALRTSVQSGRVSPGKVAQKAARLLSVAGEVGALSDDERRQFDAIGDELVGIARAVANRAITKSTVAGQEERFESAWSMTT